MWFYPLKQKSHVFDTFKCFKALVENSFGQRIGALYSDNGGEYMVMAAYLAQNGITHYRTPPHTPEHNGMSERRHRHIVETGLALLSHASIPTTYWSYAFAAAVYLINKMPTRTLSMDSPHARLFNVQPNLHKLRVFGCLCYPWLRPYATHKLDARSLPCIFLGYSNSQSAYFCLEPRSSRIFTSRHVQFCETDFPFEALSTTDSNLSSSDEQAWFPLVSPLPAGSSPLVRNSPVSTSCPVPSPASSSSTPISSSIPSLPPSPALPPIITPVSSSPSPSLETELSLPSSVPLEEPSVLAPVDAPAPAPNRVTTRSQNNIVKPNPKYALTTSVDSTIEPATITQALSDPRWRAACCSEIDSQIQYHTWDLVPRALATNIVGCRWVFRTKFNPDGSVDKFKARLVAKGYNQRPGIDFQETFSPVVKPATVRIVLSVAVGKDWSIRQLDVNNAFLQGTLTEEVYMTQPPGFVDKDNPMHVCKLRKAIYGLKQAPRAWYNELRSFLLSSGFRNSLSDASLFIYHTSYVTIYMLVYVDDILVTGSCPQRVQGFLEALARKFSLRDLGELSYFLGIEVVRSSNGIHLSQRKYILDLLRQVKMDNVKPVATPLSATASLTLHGGSPLDDASEYRMVIGSLQYLSLTRPDVSFAVNKLSQFMHQPTSDHWAAAKRVLRYLAGTIRDGIFLSRHNELALHAYSDADWDGDKDNYTSTGAYVVFLGRHPIAWSSKKQKGVARSSTEAEYRTVALTVSEVQWVMSLLGELGLRSTQQPVVYCDNIGATYLAANPVFHSRMKHVAIDYHYIRELVQDGTLRVAHVTSADQLADALTKPLSGPRFHHLFRKIGLFSGGPS